MSFGNGGGSVDTSGYSLDGGLGSYGDTGFENVPVGGLSVDNNGYQIYPSTLTDGISLDDYGNSSGGRTNVGQIINTLGRLGAGIMGGLGGYESSANQQAYIPYTQWLGNGLAKFSAINNTGNKQQQQNNAYGNALMLASLFGHGFGRNNDTIDPLPGSRSAIWD